MVRSIGSVVAGFVLWSVLWLGTNSLITVITPSSFKDDGSTDSVLILGIILALSVVFSLLSGYITAWIKRSPSNIPVWILGIILLAVGLVVQIQFWSLFPLWYSICFLLFLIPATLLGASWYRGRYT